jgi:UDP-glucuronate decarboxylase
MTRRRRAETLFFDYYRQHHLRIRVVRSSPGPRMHPNDGRVVSNFIVQALRADHPLRQRQSDPRVCYVDDLIEGFLMMAAPDDITGPMNPATRSRPRSPNWRNWSSN